MKSQFYRKNAENPCVFFKTLDSTEIKPASIFPCVWVGGRSSSPPNGEKLVVKVDGKHSPILSIKWYPLPNIHLNSPKFTIWQKKTPIPPGPEKRNGIFPAFTRLSTALVALSLCGKVAQKKVPCSLKAIKQREQMPYSNQIPDS